MMPWEKYAPTADVGSAVADQMDSIDKAGGKVDVQVSPDGKVINNSTMPVMPWTKYAAPKPVAVDKTQSSARQQLDAIQPTTKPTTTQEPQIPAYGDMNGTHAASEAGVSLISGAVATPIAGLTGLGAAIAKAFGMTDADPADIIHRVQSALTYEPKSNTAKGAVNAIGYIPGKIADVADWAGGKVAQGATAIGAPPELAAGAGAAVSAGSQVFGPALVAKGVGAAGRSVGNALDSGAQRMMQSALKPSASSLLDGKAGGAINTLLDEGINVSKGGVETLQTKIDGLNGKIKTAISNSPATIDKAAVASRLDDLVTKFQNQVNPTSDLAVIQKAHDEFINHPMLQGNRFPVQVAQDMKQGTYRALGSKSFGELKGADIEAQKALARGLKEEVASAVPEIQPLNAQESKLLGALSLTERRVLMSANNNPAGLGWLSTDPVKFAGWMADRSNLFKSLVARMLNQTGELVPAAASTATPAAVGASAISEAEQERRKRASK